MAIYHFSAKVISRADGRSAVAAAAYRAAAALEDLRTVRRYDYTAKQGVVHSAILLPDGAPARLLDRSTLWNEVEAGEKRRDAQLVRDIELSLPRELNQAAAIQLARDFVTEQFVARGMIADLNVHWGKTKEGEDQPHVHVMLTMRSVGADGFGPKVREWNATSLLVEWRERWAMLANERLSLEEHDVRIDHRSNAAQGIELEPQNKIGPAGVRRKSRAEDAERAAEHLAIARLNGERIAEVPEIALDGLTRQQSTFTRRDMARFVNRHTADAAQFTDVLTKVEASPELVRLGVDGHGTHRFTTRSMLAVEQRMEALSVMLSERQTHRVALERRRDAVGLGEEQKLALAHVTRARDLTVMAGYAGTGKSMMLGVARQAWEAEGYTVRGAALSGIAAEGLEAGAGISSRTVHSLLHAWDKGRDLLSSRDVLVVDEAGMIGSRQMERLLSAVADAGAKLVLTGDSEQLQAIEAGAAFRAIAERVGSMEITEVRRQRAAWQKEATRELATGRTAVALDRYEAAGMVTGYDTQDQAKAAVVAGWDAARRARPEASQIILTYRRDDVRDLNELARAVRRAAGELGEDHLLATEMGTLAFAEGDRLYFLRNERGLGVKNGTLGTLERIEGGRLTVRLDSAAGGGRGRSVSFDLGDYAHINHGYAATVHKSQGVTVDLAHVLASRLMDRHAAYVGLTRHRDSVQLHWSDEEIGSRAALSSRLGRDGLKDTSLDYRPSASGSAGRAQEQAEQAELARAYGERRGLHPLVPVSQIVVPTGQAEQAVGPRVPLPLLARRKAEHRTLLSGLRSMLQMQEAETDLLGWVSEALVAVAARRQAEAKAAAATAVLKAAGMASAALAALARAEAKGKAQVERAVLTLLQESTPGWGSSGSFGSAKQGQVDYQTLAEARARLAVETPVLLAATVPGTPDPTPAAVREAIASDPWVGTLRQMIADLVPTIYRDPDEARRQLGALEASVGLRGVQQVLGEEPERFGALLGRAPGLLTSSKAVTQRRDATEAVIELKRYFATLEKAQWEILDRLHEQARVRRLQEGTVVHDLSPGARAAAETLEAASARLRWTSLYKWREVDQRVGDDEQKRPPLVTERAPMLQAWKAAASDPRTWAELVRLEASVRQRLTPDDLGLFAQVWLNSSVQTRRYVEPIYRAAAWAVLVDHACGVAATGRVWQAQADAARQRAEEKARLEAEQARIREEKRLDYQRQQSRPGPRPEPSSGPSMG